MKVFLKSSTRPNGFVSTRISYRVDDGPIEQVDGDGTETLALLALMTGLVEKSGYKTVIEIHSKPNTFTNPFTEGWIRNWEQDGFRKKPPRHRTEWKRFWELINQQQVRLEFRYRSDAELEAVLNPRPPEPPGTPVENPWAKPDGADAMVRRASKKRA